MHIIGDIMHTAGIQLPHPEITVDFDADESLVAETRRATLAELARTHELVAAPHISFPGLGHSIRTSAGYAWMPSPVLQLSLR